MLSGLCDWGVGASRVTLAIALAILHCTAVVLLLLFPKSGQGGQSGSVKLVMPGGCRNRLAINNGTITLNSSTGVLEFSEC